jgi:lysophosphatidate acyltransferase
MVTALESISRPGPSHQHDIQVTPEDLQTPKAELSRQLGHGLDEKDKARRRDQETSNETSATTGSELHPVDSRGGESTEDEMDEDAVLLKHPKHE